MPYIKQKNRNKFGASIKKVSAKIESTGDLNYVISLLCKSWFQKSPCYQSVNDVLGALRGVGLEFYRRIAAPYEDKKKDQNGDIF